jgi:hypothetical protein
VAKGAILLVSSANNRRSRSSPKRLKPVWRSAFPTGAPAAERSECGHLQEDVPARRRHDRLRNARAAEPGTEVHSAWRACESRWLGRKFWLAAKESLRSS